jgi:hypothetical protein
MSSLTYDIDMSAEKTEMHTAEDMYNISVQFAHFYMTCARFKRQAQGQKSQKAVRLGVRSDVILTARLYYNNLQVSGLQSFQGSMHQASSFKEGDESKSESAEQYLCALGSCRSSDGMPSDHMYDSSLSHENRLDCIHSRGYICYFPIIRGQGIITKHVHEQKAADERI